MHLFNSYIFNIYYLPDTELGIIRFEIEQIDIDKVSVVRIKR